MSNNSNQYYDLIKRCLVQELKNKELQLEVLTEPSPLLIMEAKEDIAAFAIIDGYPEKNYEDAYNAFKKLYNERHSKWAKCYLSFILCKTDGTPEDDELFNRIENDVYFCKKYVLSLNHSPESFQKEIGCLPFVPLEPYSITNIKRPLSAQSLLMNSGISSQLASYIVKARERSAEEIVRDCLSNIFTIEEIKEKIKSQIPERRETSKTTKRIKSLTINNFRAYIEQQFNFDADLIILYGPNGLGKTSLFDALDFACTGRIGRLSGDIRTLAPHLDHKDKESCVSIEIKDNSSIRKIIRRVSDCNYPNMDSLRSSRKDVLIYLTDIIWEDPALRVENLEKLFSATHLFGQHCQELLTDYGEKSQLSEEIVARMLAFEDYVMGDKKIQQVVKELQVQKESLLNKSDNLKSELNKKEEQLKQVKKTTILAESPASLKKLSQEVASKINKVLNSQLSIVSQIDKEEIHNWRTQVSSELKVNELKLEKINYIGRYLDDHKKKKDRIKKLFTVYEDLKNKIINVEEEVQKKKKIKDGIFNNIQVFKKSEYELLEKVNNYTWQRDSIETYQKLGSEANKYDKELSKDNISEDIIKKVKELELLKSDLLFIQNNMDIWKRNRDRQKEIQAKLSIIKNEIAAYTNEKSNLEKEISQQNSKFTQAESVVRELRENESVLMALLDKAETLVKDSICPVCGDNHQTIENLLGKIRARKKSRPIEMDNMVKTFQSHEKAISDLRNRINNIERIILAHTQEGDKLTLENREIKVRSSEFEILCSKHNLQLDKITQENIKQKYLDTAVLIDLIIKYLSTKALIQNIEKDALSKNVSLKESKDAIANLLNQAEKKLSETKAEIIKKTQQQNKIDNELESYNDQFKKINGETELIKKDVESYSKDINKFDLELEKVGFKEDVKIDAVQKEENILREKIQEINQLISDIINLESTFDSSQQSVLMAILNKDIKTGNEQLMSVKNEIDTVENWIKYFSKLQKLLNDERECAIRKYIESYGPLSSIIQRKLRHVYGFGGVHLKAKKGEIYIEVERKSERYKPTDYFSDSQNQVLMLSLFLAAGITQTWSSFAPILMDDPVTHFDDLNAYAFAELIRNLIDNPNNQRQLIISTCDENMWGLFRQRFQNLDARTIMYKFISLGKNGPVIERIQ